LGLFCLSRSRRWYYILPMAPFCAIMMAAALDNLTDAGTKFSKWLALAGSAILALMRYCLIVAGSLATASALLIPLLPSIVEFDIPWTILVGVPVGGVLLLALMLFDRQPGEPVSRLTGLAANHAGVVVGCALVVAIIFGCLLPSITKYRTAKPFYQSFRHRCTGIPPEAILEINTRSTGEYLFYAQTTGPVTWATLGETRRIADFFERHRGRRVAVMTEVKQRDLAKLERLFAENRLPVSVKRPSIVETDSFGKTDVSPERKKYLAGWIFEMSPAQP
ncbi:MAG: hypothetical protein PHI35_07115, partial [Victivallaceae bacterium]|nr:hypothetical protein [Victivallaceae bacterium]